MAWTGLLSFFALVLLVVVTVSYGRSRSAKNNESVERLPTSAGIDSAFSKPKLPEHTEPPPLEAEEAIGIVRSALNNTDPSLITDFYTLSSGDGTLSAAEALERLSNLEGKITDIQWIGNRFFNGKTVCEVVVSMNEDAKKKNRLAQLTAGLDGKWRINLDSYLRKVTPSWDLILSGEAEISIVRVFVEDDTYYNGIYSNESEWAAYALASPDVNGILYAYAKRGTSQDKALEKILTSDERYHRATLELRKNLDSASRQFEIQSVIAESWVISGTENFDKTL